jgi:hypothetical protein
VTYRRSAPANQAVRAKLSANRAVQIQPFDGRPDAGPEREWATRTLCRWSLGRVPPGLNDRQPARGPLATPRLLELVDRPARLRAESGGRCSALALHGHQPHPPLAEAGPGLRRRPSTPRAAISTRRARPTDRRSPSAMNAIATLEGWALALLLGAVLVAVAAGVAFGLGARIRRGELAELVTATTIGVVGIAELTAVLR